MTNTEDAGPGSVIIMLSNAPSSGATVSWCVENRISFGKASRVSGFMY